MKYDMAKYLWWAIVAAVIITIITNALSGLALPNLNDAMAPLPNAAYTEYQNHVVRELALIRHYIALVFILIAVTESRK